MKKIIAIASKELEIYFKSPTAYIILAITTATFNTFFFMIIGQNREASLRDMFKLMEFMFVFIIPLLTMRAFAEEKRTGTLEFLITSPISKNEIVLGKYVGHLLFFTLIIFLTSAYYWLIEYFANPDKTAIFTGYLGLWFEGALFVAIGLLTSSWTRNQIIAAISSYAILLLLYFSIAIVQYAQPPLQDLVRQIGAWHHSEDLNSGIINTSNIIYFISGILFCLGLTRLQLGKKGWLLLAILLTACLIAINASASKFDYRFDLTQNKQHTLSTETIHALKNIKANVKLTAFYVGLPPTYLQDMFNEYQRLSSGHIKSEIINPLDQIGYAASFGNVISGDEKKVIIQSNGERKDIDFKDAPLTEELLTNAIIKVTRDKRKVYFLTGHDEFNIDDKGPNGYNQFHQLLEKANCQVEKLMLGITKEIPVDTDVLIVAGPKKPFTPEEEKIVEQYLEKGGNVLFFLEPPLNSLLNKWGIDVGNNIVVDLENYIGQDVGCPVTKNYPPHKEIVNGLDYTFYIRPRSISLIPVPSQSSPIKIAPLVLTASREKSWAETDKNLQVHFDPNQDIKGPIVIAAVIWQAKNKIKQADTKLIVFTDAEFITNNFIQEYSNAAIALNSVSWLSELENIIAIPKKDLKPAPLNLTSKQKYLVTVVLIAMPLFIIVLGIFANLSPRLKS